MSRLFALLAVMAPAILAQPNFSGSWMLNTAKSQYGAFPAPDVMLRTIDQSGATLKMSTYQKGAQGEVSSELSYTTDGSAAVNGSSRGSARWDGDTLLIESSRELDGARLTQREVWSLSADGKTLTIVTRVALPQQGEFEVKQVFEKTPQAGPRASL